MKKLLVICLISFSGFSQNKNEDFKLVLQKVFTLESVEAFFLDMNPIYIVENQKLKKNTIRNVQNPFKLVPKSEIRKDKIEDYIVFDEIELEKKSAKIKFSYEREGMHAEINLIKENNNWIVANEKVYEH